MLQDPDNIGESISSFVDNIVKADSYVVLIYIRLQQAAIFDFPDILILDNVVTCPGVLRDPGNISPLEFRCYSVRYTICHI